MPRRTDIKSILIIGAGPIVIGQACEFDYSGVQACKALKDEGYRVILVNSNPATIMTDPGLADATYIEPITPEIVARIIEKERPDALLPTMGGQTALNTAMALADDGTLEKFGVEMIAAKRDVIARPRTACCSATRWTRSASKARNPRWCAISAKPARPWPSSACPRSSAPASPWPAPAAASPIMPRNSSRSSRAAWRPARCTRFWSRNRCWAGRI